VGGESLDFFDAKGYLERLFVGLSVAATYVEAEEFGLVPGRTASIRVGETTVGVLGQVDPRLASQFDLEGDVFLFDLSLEDLLSAGESARKGARSGYQPVPRFPPVVQDMALVLDEGVPAARVREIIEGAGLVRRARLFDVYSGAPVPAGKRSLAFSVTYQSPDHTLTDEEVARAQRGILERLKRQVGAVLRG
jgi:phenylalanyl-tRNA synthetase beta chain